jgi:hypothetical protein
LHQSELCARTEVRVLMRALRRSVTELGLDRLDGVAGRRGLAGHRMKANLVVPELSEPERPLHGP